jgi:hypothetical protein
MFPGSSAPLLISSTKRISQPWSHPPSNQWLWSSLPSRPARLWILLHLHATRRPQLHRQAQQPGNPANPSLRPHPPPNRTASPGSRMPAGPQAWRRSRRGTPQNAKPNCANDPKGYGYRSPAPSAPAPAATEQRHAPANSTTKLFSCARTTRTTPTRSPQPFNSSPRRTTPTRPSDPNAPIPFEFEPVRTAEDARNALTAVIGAMAASEITGAEAACLACRRADHAVSRITQRR